METFENMQNYKDCVFSTTLSVNLSSVHT